MHAPHRNKCGLPINSHLFFGLGEPGYRDDALLLLPAAADRSFFPHFHPGVFILALFWPRGDSAETHQSVLWPLTAECARIFPPCQHVLNNTKAVRLSSFNDGSLYKSAYLSSLAKANFGSWFPNFLFLFIYLLWDRISLCSPGYFGTSYVDQAGLKLTEFCQPLAAKCWD